MAAKKRIGTVVYHILVSLGAIVMIYPLLWMIMSSFKETSTVFTTAASLIPQKFVIENYINGWRGFAGVSFAVFFKNSFIISVSATFGTLISSALFAYALQILNFAPHREEVAL